MKKILSIILSFVLLFAIVPAFADGVNANDAVAKLQAYDIIKGNTQGDLMMNEELTRQDAAIILCRMMGVEDEAKSFDSSNLKFTDVQDKLGSETARMLAYAVDKKWFRGMTKSYFGWNKAITARQFATVLLRTLGYDPVFASAYEGASKLGLFDGATGVADESPIIRKNVFVAMVNTLDTKKKGGDKPLKEVLGLEGVEAKEFAVTSIEPAGLRAIWIQFNKPVDEKSLQNIEVKDGSNSFIMANGSKKYVVLSADKKLAAVVLKNEANLQNKKLSVIVKDVLCFKKTMKVVEKKADVTLLDMKRPQILKAEAINQKLIRLTTSEPLDFGHGITSYYKKIMLDGRKLNARISKSYLNYMDIEFNRSLSAGKHSIKVSGIVDYNNYPVEVFEGEVNVTVDNNPPVLEKMEVIDDKTIKATFDEAIDPNHKGEFYINGVQSPITVNENVLTIKLSQKLGIEAIVEVKAKYKGQTDLLGNKIKSTQKMTFQAENDASVSEVEITAVDSSSVTLKFTKPMDANSGYIWVIKDAKNHVVTSGAHAGSSVEWVAGKDGKVLILKSSSLTGRDVEKLTLILEKFRDSTVRHIEMPKTTLDFDCKDSKRPVAINIDGASNGDQQQYFWSEAHSDDNNIIVIQFSESMQMDALQDENNYRIYDANKEFMGILSNVKKASLDVVSDKEVHIVLDKKIPGITPNDLLKVVRAKDIAGNTLDDANYIHPANPKQVSVENTYLKKDEEGTYYLELELDAKVIVNDASGIKYGQDAIMHLTGEGFSDRVKLAIPSGVTVDEDDDNKGFSTNITLSNKALITQYGKGLETGQGETDVTLLANKMVDKVAPTVKEVEFITAKKIEITYSEKVNAVNSRVVLKDNHILNLASDVTGNKVTLTLTEDAKAGEVYTVQIQVSDVGGNTEGLVTKDLVYEAN